MDSEPQEIDLSHRFWIDDDCDGRIWMTDFPPPADFTGYQSCDYGDPDRIYKRECTPEEAEILEADAARSRATERADEEALRDEWLALLREDAELHPAPGESAPIAAPPESRPDSR